MSYVAFVCCSFVLNFSHSLPVQEKIAVPEKTSNFSQVQLLSKLFQPKTFQDKTQVELNRDALQALKHFPIHQKFLTTLYDVQGQPFSIETERFEILSNNSRFVLGKRNGEEVDFKIPEVILLRGEVPDFVGSRFFLAISEIPQGNRGWLQLGEGDSNYVITREAHTDHQAPFAQILTLSPALAKAELELPGGIDFCAAQNVAAELIQKTFPQSQALSSNLPIKTLRLAVDTDHEFSSRFLHQNLDAAAAYVLALYGQVSDLFLRDLKVRIELSYVRFFTSVFDEPDFMHQVDPLTDFVQYWQPIDSVERDLVQYLSGRFNMPYGGVAFIPPSCQSWETQGYSIASQLRGYFPSPALSSVGHWDLIVTAHELGHNFGARHTHELQPPIDSCYPLPGICSRGTLMSYCHVQPGQTANIDLYFHRVQQSGMQNFLHSFSCLEDAGLPESPAADCNGNQISDEDEALIGAVEDTNGNNIPDECESDCNQNGIPDHREIQADMTLDADRNLKLDSCQDCDGNGIWDWRDLGFPGGVYAIVSDSQTQGVRLFAPMLRRGVPAGDFGLSQLSNPKRMVRNSEGHFFVTSSFSTVKRVVEFDEEGNYVRDFVRSGPSNGGLLSPGSLIFRPNGNLLVADSIADRVLEYDRVSGDFLRVFIAAGAGGLDAPSGICYGPNGHLLIGSRVAGQTFVGQVLQFDGESGEFLNVFVQAGAGGLGLPTALQFHPDGYLLVADSVASGGAKIRRYHGEDGSYLGNFGNFSTPLDEVRSFAFGSGNSFYCSARLQFPDNLGQQQYIFKSVAQPGSFMEIFDRSSQAYDLIALPGLDAPDCNRNFIPDDCDIQTGVSLDGNQNGIPDLCETDCNQNATPDYLDIRPFGPSFDFNVNGIPDECEQDCSGDGILDEFEPDCNGNRVPDSCEISSGAAQDCNENDIPDDCEIYGDLDGNGVVTLEDILCAVGGFQNFASCPLGDLYPCGGGDGRIDLMDLLAILRAFSGSSVCSSPCAQ